MPETRGGVAAGSDDDRSARNSVGGQDSASRESMDDAANDALALDFVSAWDQSDNPPAVRDARAGIPEGSHSTGSNSSSQSAQKGVTVSGSNGLSGSAEDRRTSW